MKAIAKYLPVEGEIKDGDTILHHKGGLYTAISNDGVLCIDTEEYSGAIGPELYKVVKLFAVTQDIEVGDEIWDLFKGVKHGIAEKVHEDYIEFKDLSYSMDRTSGGAVKILGELSPNATWEIKDGEEIRVKEFDCYIEKDGGKVWGGRDASNLTSEAISELLERKTFLKVLGPCGHYH